LAYSLLQNSEAVRLDKFYPLSKSLQSNWLDSSLLYCERSAKQRSIISKQKAKKTIL